MGFFRPTFAEIDLNNLAHNYNKICRCLPENTEIMAMVKADAYGHGAVRVSKRLESQGVASLGVATVEEGLELRESGIKSPIVVMGGLMGMGSPASGMMLGARLTPVVHSIGVLEALESMCRSAGKSINIHLKIDSGMTRMGALPKNIDNILNRLAECKHVKLEGVMTHFAEAYDPEYTSYQMNIFSEAAKKIKNTVGPIDIWHVANSAAAIDGEFVVTNADSKNWVRPGLALYGAYPVPRYKDRIELKPVMSLKSSVVLMKTVPEGTKVSYDCTFETKRKSLLGIIPIGYADGYPWSLSNKSSVLVKGKRFPVVGRVTMDMIIVDFTDGDVNFGDEVVLMGNQEKETVTVDELADLAGTISYELFCGISKRMPRVYVE